jgi:hypothetical protein
MGNGNRLTAELRREAVRLALTSGRTRREIAEDLGIGLPPAVVGLRASSTRSCVATCNSKKISG